MKTLILVIASINSPLYIHYINTYWTKVINYTNLYKPNIDIFLLFNGDTDSIYFRNIQKNVITDNNLTSYEPGILLKTIYAFEILQNKYDIFYRTNLSSMIKIRLFKDFINNNNIIYSGGLIWGNYLREHLINMNLLKKNKMKELNSYKGNTFISGSGYFLNKLKIKDILKNKNKIRYDLPDDVSIGLMMSNYKIINNFTTIINSNILTEYKLNKIKNANSITIRLQHLTLNEAEDLWLSLENNNITLFQ